jgi:hypothetical protein
MCNDWYECMVLSHVRDMHVANASSDAEPPRRRLYFEGMSLFTRSRNSPGVIRLSCHLHIVNGEGKKCIARF